MRRIASLGFVGAVLAGVLTGAGTGVAHADTVPCLQTTGAKVCWDENTHVLTVYDTLQDGDTAYALLIDYIQPPYIAFNTCCGAGTHISANLTGEQDFFTNEQGDVIFEAARVNSAGKILNESGYQAFPW